MSFSLNVCESMDLCLSGVRLCFSFYTFCLSTRKYLLSHQVQETETSTKSINTPGGSEVLIIFQTPHVAIVHGMQLLLVLDNLNEV